MAKRYLLVTTAGGTDYTIPESSISQEIDLQEAFKQHPELIPTADLSLSSLLVIGRETTVTSGGAVDLLAVDQLGHVVIVEFKRGPENPDSRRVIAQILEYASCLWGMSYEDIDDVAQRFFRSDRCVEPAARAADSLEQAAAATWGGGEGFSAESFRDGITAALANGELHCIVISSDIDANTRKVIGFLNATARFRCFGIEVDHFSDAERRVFVPRASVLPPPTTGASTSSGIPKTTRENFLAACGEPAKRFFSRALDYMESTGEAVYWGYKGFSFRVHVGGCLRTVFYGWPRGAQAKDRDIAQLVVSELRKAGVPEATLNEYTAAAAGLVVTSVSETGQVSFDVNERLDDNQTGVVIAALRRLLENVKHA